MQQHAGSGSSVLVEVKGLRKSFGDITAVDHIEFSFRGGEVHGFLGPNGAGKTTTMRMIATLEDPDEGDVLVDGLSATNYPDQVRPLIGFMPDYLDSYKHMVVGEYLDFYARAYRLTPGYKARRMADVIEFTGLGRLLQRPVERLSKGERQRLSLGRVLINDPKVLILDEPAAGLDPRARVELRALMRRLADNGKAVLVSSHILTELSEICDAVTIIEHGRVRASDSVQGLRRQVETGTRVTVGLEHADDETKARLVRALAELEAVREAQVTKQGASFHYQGGASIRSGILIELVRQGFAVTDFHAVSTDLEDAFLSLTTGTEA